MDDLKIAQAMGAVEGPFQVLLADAEAQGRIAGAAAEAERIWQAGKLLAQEWEADRTIARESHVSFLAELRRRVLREVPENPPHALPSQEPPAATVADLRQRIEEELAAQRRGDAQGAPGAAFNLGARLPVPEPPIDGTQDAQQPVKPFDGAGVAAAKL